ncbi:hypothetical protein CGCF413_v006194 [Colletotrichum fructicola]|nr:hypothetical protein CGCF413_v006194 [Colletotrichum fructicola]
MAEVLGTVVGVISLGIQVSSAIGAYIEGVQCRKEEVESTRRYQKSFQVLLTQISSLKDHLLKSSISNTAALEEALKAANAQIAQLDGFLGKILVPDHSSSSKDQLDAVEQKLEATNIAFQSAMQVMELEMSVTVQASVYQIQKETTTTNSVLLDIKNNIDRGTMYNQSNNLATKTDMDELNQCPEFFELYSGHPTEAIISRNAAALRYVLDRNVSLSELSELDAFGNNSLNHLLSWPEGLKIVLDCFGSRVFDTPGETLILEYALFWSGYICDPNASAKCREDCACTYVVKLIMDMDIECLAKTTGRHFWMTSVAHASVKARELLIVHLRDAKQELKALALTHLAPQEIEEWDLRSPSILDYHTNSVLAALDHRKQHVPYRLVTNRGEDYEDYYTSFSITS